MNRLLTRPLGAVGATLVAGAVTLGFTAGPALAAGATTSQATANAIGGNLVNSGTCIATNDNTVASPGTQTTTTAPAVLSLNVGCTSPNQPAGGSNSNSALSVAAIVQDAIANNDATSTTTGSSLACAGVAGPGGGAVQIGASGQCSVASGTSSGVNLLGGILTADAIYASCSDFNGTLIGQSTLVSANLLAGPLGILLGTVTGTGALPTNPTVGFTQPVSLSILGGVSTPLLTLTLNQQSTVNGQLTVTALDLSVLPGLMNLLPSLGLNGSGIEIKIGTVTCGPNAVVAPTTTSTTTPGTTTPPTSIPTTTPTMAVSALPGKGLPIAGGVLALVGVGAFLARRRLLSALRG